MPNLADLFVAGSICCLMATAKKLNVLGDALGATVRTIFGLNRSQKP